MNFRWTILIFFCGTFGLSAQYALPDSCKLEIGTNLAGLADWGTELPFVDLMRNSREWYTKSVGDPNYPWNSEMAPFLAYRSDGYPTHLPQDIPESVYPQRVATIWAITDSWPAGNYTVLWDGTGTLDFWGGYTNLQQTGPNRITFDFLDPIGNILEMILLTSDINDPIHNIRVLMPGTEDTYLDEPFYDLWLNRVGPFQALRFMDWGSTNGWGQDDSWDWQDPTLANWEDRAQMDYYTWTTSKGIPYEMMIRLMNDHDFDGWVCVPHTASDDYIQKMAELFRDQLEPDRHLYVEYSNEIWNWIFGQTQWLNEYGCIQQGEIWPEGIVPYVQNCLDIWTTVFVDEPSRITRAAGVQTGWLDVSERIIYNLAPASLDAVSPTYYFGLSGEADEVLDGLGAAATVADIAYWARQEMPVTFDYILGIQSIADSLGKGLVFYEGGQHLTPHPFGQVPTYEQALLDIHRDTSMYNLYNEWFDMLRSIQEGEEPLQLMNFSFISGRSAQYGSWGLLEFMDQDTSVIPAPKYAAVLENMNSGCQQITTGQTETAITGISAVQLYPNPVEDQLFLVLDNQYPEAAIRIYDLNGRVRLQQYLNGNAIDVGQLPEGIYILELLSQESSIDLVRFVKL